MHHLTVAVDTVWDWLVCSEFGLVDDGLPDECYEVLIEDSVALMRHPVHGHIAGFSVICWSEFEATDQPELFGDEYRFDVPQLGLTNARIGEICIAVRTWLGDEPTAARAYFQAGVSAETPAEAIECWQLALEMGDLPSHYGLGYTYLEAGEPHRAYAHLRAYTELAPWNGWAWNYRGRAEAALGQHADARESYGRAMDIEAQGGHATDAEDLLAQLGGE